jgi:hypothetical protein
VEELNDFHSSRPESEEFLKADLTKDTSQDLAYAEQIHKCDELLVYGFESHTNWRIDNGPQQAVVTGFRSRSDVDAQTLI